MKLTNYFLPTVKETPADAEVKSHRLMLRAGMIRKLTSGVYTWLPLGHRVLRKVMQVIREEMNAAGAIELLMPSVQPAELWHETGRWDQYGPELLKMNDRHDRAFCYGPTHEEVITTLLKGDVRSYKQLPLNLYQIQTKFRDEIRPRFGVMRAREFTMKDAYSFHISQASQEETYWKMHEAYSKIFTRLGLDFRPVLADSGAIGGSVSHEFHVLAETGEDELLFSDGSDYAANAERAETVAPAGDRPAPGAEMAKVETPGIRTIEAGVEFLKLPITQHVKTMIAEGAEEGSLVGFILRGDHELNTHKAEKLPGVKMPLSLASEEAIRAAMSAGPGSLGPVGMQIPFYVDRDAAVLADFCCGANEDDQHYTNVNWERDVTLPEVVDIRVVKAGEASPDGKGTLYRARGIEVGHIFQLGSKYSEALGATVLDEGGKQVPMAMGCYGIGVSRIVAAAIEQNHDDRGIIWPEPMAPFQVIILPMNMHKSYRVREACDALYEQLTQAGIEVLYDDRKVRPGFMFADAELIGVPHKVVVSEAHLDEGLYEYQRRGEDEKRMVKIEALMLSLSGLSGESIR